MSRLKLRQTLKIIPASLVLFENFLENYHNENMTTKDEIEMF